MVFYIVFAGFVVYTGLNYINNSKQEVDEKEENLLDGIDDNEVKKDK